MPSVREQLIDIYENKASDRYGLSDVSQLQHALQAAAMAEANQENSEFIVSALLHDVGHMIHTLGEDCAVDGLDDVHEERAAAWLKRYFSLAVTEPIRLHVPAKRYLCAVDETYFSKLASDSIRSLALQGGPMSKSEIIEFEKNPYYDSAVRLRRLDDQAKDPAARTPDFRYFLKHLDAVLGREQVA